MTRHGPLLKLATALTLISATAGSFAGNDEASTVGSITRNNGRNSNGYFEIATPSILRVTTSRPLPANVREAIAQYDQLIELHPDPVILAEALRRSADLRVQLADSEGGGDPAELQTAIARYQRLLKEIPGYEYSDRVLYQLARAYQLSGDSEQAIASLQTLAAHDPDSPHLGDASFRAAEWLYAKGRYDQAEPLYRTAMSVGGDNPLQALAEYKYGWSLYKQNKYAQALAVFLPILDRVLPADVSDPAAVRAGNASRNNPDAAEVLRVTSLSFAALGGGPAINDYFAGSGREPRYAVLLYRALADQLMQRQRYSDAAGSYAAFIARHPDDPLAPAFQVQVIAADLKGGFNDLAINAKETYISRYAPGSPYWAGNAPPPTVMAELQKDLTDVSGYYHARAQQTAASDADARKAMFLKAAGWYRKTLEIFPAAANATDISMRCADALYDGGQTEAAARQYALTAYGDSSNPKAPEAAYAAVQAWQRLSNEVSGDARQAALRQSVAASVRLADTFAQHPQRGAVLTRAAGDVYSTGDDPQAVALAQRALQAPLTGGQRRDAQAVLADAYFAQQQYPQAEAAYSSLMPLIPADDPQRQRANEQLAASIYKQGEAARTAGDLRAAASDFQRVGRAAPGTSIQANADYDAAAAFIKLKDWRNAEVTLETFLSRYPKHALVPDADKKLAYAYQSDGQPSQAAGVYRRIAARDGESPDTRRDAAWLSAQLSDQAHASDDAARAYEAYVSTYPQPMDRAMAARRRLADIARDSRHDDAGYQRWLHALIDADRHAETRSDSSRQMAAQASLELGQLAAAQARALTLSMPFSKSLPRRKKATEEAVAELDQAAAYGDAAITTAATYEAGMAYRDFGRALLDSQRPPQLKGDALEQYNILLEEQANPFEEKAIAIHEANLQRLRQGLWNDAIRKSITALAELAPARYGKHEQRENSYDSLH